MAYETLRAFLPELPMLTQIIEAELASAPPATNNSAEIRDAYQAASQRAFEFLKQSGLPYTLITYPEFVSTCQACGEELKGAYWELNNPSGKGCTQPLKGYHMFVAHGATEYPEVTTNLSNTVLGHHPLRFDLAAVRQVLVGIPLPSEIEAELASVPVPAL